MRKLHLERKQERGQAVVELALVMPFLVLVLAGLTHFGYVLNAKQVITNASRVAARIVTLPESDQTSVNATVAAYCEDAGLDPTKVQLQISMDTAASMVTATVTYPFSSPMDSIFAAITGSTMGEITGGTTGDITGGPPPETTSDLTATTVMRY